MACLIGLAALEQILTGLEHLVGMSLTLGKRRPCPIDIRAGTGMRSIEEQNARPDVDRVFVSAFEVPVESVDEQRFSLAVPVVHALVVSDRRQIRASRVWHCLSPGDYSEWYRSVQERTSGRVSELASQHACEQDLTCSLACSPACELACTEQPKVALCKLVIQPHRC